MHYRTHMGMIKYGCSMGIEEQMFLLTTNVIF